MMGLLFPIQTIFKIQKRRELASSLDVDHIKAVATHHETHRQDTTGYATVSIDW